MRRVVDAYRDWVGRPASQPGRLQVAAAAVGDYRLGRFRVRLHGGGMTVEHAPEYGAPYPGAPYLGAPEHDGPAHDGPELGAHADGGRARLVWTSARGGPGQSAAGSAFLAAVRGSIGATGTAGHLTLREAVERRYGDQSVDALERGGAAGSLVLKGRLWAAGSGGMAGDRSPAGRPDHVGYSLTIAAVDHEQLELRLELDDPGASASPAPGSTPSLWAELLWDQSEATAQFGFGVQFSLVDLKGRR